MLIDLAEMAKIHKFGLANSLLDSPLATWLTLTGTLNRVLHKTRRCCSESVGDRVVLTEGVVDLNLPPLPEEEYPLPVRSICLYLFQKTRYRLPRREAEDGTTR